MQLNIRRALWSFSKKLAIFWLVFRLCWKVLEKNRYCMHHFGMPEQQTSHWRRQIVRIASRCCQSVAGLWWQNSSRCI
ncbi:hypothetical protein ACNKHN_02245 [Shigella flexneri]